MLLKRLITQLVNAAHKFSDARGIVPRPTGKGLVTNDDDFMGDLADVDQRIGRDPAELRPDYYGHLGKGVRKNVTAPNLNDPKDPRGSDLRKKIIPDLWRKTRDENPQATPEQIQQYIFRSLEPVRMSLPVDQQSIFEQQLSELLSSIASSESQMRGQIEQRDQETEQISPEENRSTQRDNQGNIIGKISKQESQLINKCIAIQISNTLNRRLPVSFSLTQPRDMTGEFAIIGNSPRLEAEYLSRMNKIREEWTEDPNIVYEACQKKGLALPYAVDPATGQRTRPLTYDEFATIEDLVSQKPAMNQQTLDDLRQREGEDQYQHMMKKIERDGKTVDAEIEKILGVAPQEETNEEEMLEMPEALMPKDLKMWASRLPSVVYEELGMNSDQIYRTVERLSRPDQRKFVKQIKDMSYTGSEKQHVSLQQQDSKSGEEVTIDPVANKWQEGIAGRRAGWERMSEEEASNVEQKKGHGIKQIQDLYDSINSVGQSVVGDLTRQIQERQSKVNLSEPEKKELKKLIEVRNFLKISIPYVAKGIDAFSKKGIREIFDNPEQLAEFRKAGITVNVIEGDKRRKITLQPGALGDVSDRTAIEIGPAVSWDKVDLSKLLGMRSQVDMVKEFIASLDKSKPAEFQGEYESYEDLLYRPGDRSKPRTYEELSKVSEFGIRHLSNWIEQNLHPREGQQRSAVNPSVFKAFMQIMKPRRAVVDRAVLTSQSVDSSEKISAARRYLASFFRAQYLTHKRNKKDKKELPVFHKAKRLWLDKEETIPDLNEQGIQKKRNSVDQKALDTYLQGNPVYSTQGEEYASKPGSSFAFQQLRPTGPFNPIERINRQTGQKEQIRPGLTEDDFFPEEDGTPPSVTDQDIMNVLPLVEKEIAQSPSTTGWEAVQRVYDAPAWDNAVTQAYLDFVDRLFKLADIRYSLAKFGSVDMVDALVRKARYDLKYKLYRIRKSYEDYMRM